MSDRFSVSFVLAVGDDPEWTITVATPPSPEDLDGTVLPTLLLTMEVAGTEFSHRLPVLTLLEPDAQRLQTALSTALTTERDRAARQGRYGPVKPSTPSAGYLGERAKLSW